MLRIAGGDPEPARPGDGTPAGLDAFNTAVVKQQRHLPLTAVLHELGEARGVFYGNILSLPPALLQSEAVQDVIQRRRRHDLHHLPTIRETIRQYHEL